MSQSQKEAAEYAEVLMAYSRGAEIQMRRHLERVDDEWSGLTYPLWDFARFEYRVAPKPVERWAVLLNDAAGEYVFEWSSIKSEAQLIAQGKGGRAALMREVTE